MTCDPKQFFVSLAQYLQAFKVIGNRISAIYTRTYYYEWSDNKPMVNVKPVQMGNTTRMSFGKIDEVIGMPNLIEIQKRSFEWFLNDGLKEVFKDISGISDHSGNLVLDFVDYFLDIDHPKHSVIECKERDATYSAPLRVTARLINRETGEVKESNIFMGDFPLMTASGTFVINGAERVIVSQLVRSPGVYYKMDHDKTGKELFSSAVIPNRGAWKRLPTVTAAPTSIQASECFFANFTLSDTQ